MNLLERYNSGTIKDNDSQYWRNPNYPTDKESYHSYISEYYCEAFSDIECYNLLEIGVYAGGSIKLWRDHFEKAEIYGIDIDINQALKIIGDNKERINLISMNAYSIDTIKYLSDKKFDIIIEDGPHTLDSLLFVIKNYLSLLTSSGKLIIEDIQDEKWFNKLIQNIPTGYKYQIIDLRKIKNRYDDLLMIISKYE